MEPGKMSAHIEQCWRPTAPEQGEDTEFELAARIAELVTRYGPIPLNIGTPKVEALYAIKRCLESMSTAVKASL